MEKKQENNANKVDIVQVTTRTFIPIRDRKNGANKWRNIPLNGSDIVYSVNTNLRQQFLPTKMCEKTNYSRLARR